MANDHLRQLCLWLDFPGIGLRALEIDHSLLELFDISCTRIVRVTAFRWDDGGNYSWLVPMSSLILSPPGIIYGIQIKVASGFIVVYLFRVYGMCDFESVGIEWRSCAIIIICDYEVLLEGGSNFLIMGLGFGLEELRDIDVFRPLLFVLLALQALHLYQVSHFNFTKLRLLSRINIIGREMWGSISKVSEKIFEKGDIFEGHVRVQMKFI